MAKVSPFKGWRYNPDIVNRIEDVFVPPYDVITSEEQDQYYNKSPHSYNRIKDWYGNNLPEHNYA